MSNCFLIIPSFSELLLVLYEPTECTFIHIIVYFLGNIANCARQESRTPVRPTRGERLRRPTIVEQPAIRFIEYLCRSRLL